MISFLIVIPTLNSHRLLPGLVQSLRDQTYDCWRVLFLDGGSLEEHCLWLKKITREDSRFSWVSQTNSDGIYGAMNQGMQMAEKDDWVIFWGSDDLAAEPHVIEKVSLRIEEDRRSGHEADIYICMGRYFSLKRDDSSGFRVNRRKRISSFNMRDSFRASLFWGSCPPHQGTIFGPGARKILDSFDPAFSLAADLDYFLRLSEFHKVRVDLINLVLVLMGDSGVSAKETQRRLKEVMLAYQNAFGKIWFVSFISRYLRRIQSMLFV